MTATLERPSIRAMTDAELRDSWAVGAVDLASLTVECSRRDRADKRAARTRAASRQRHTDWEAAAYAQYVKADERCRGNLLSDAGKRRKRDPWPMLWLGSEADARKLASDELVTVWDWESPRVPSPADMAARKRAEMAEAQARSLPPIAAKEPRLTAADLAVMAARGEVPARTEPGSIARYITALGHLTRQADATARSLARVNGGLPR